MKRDDSDELVILRGDYAAALANKDSRTRAKYGILGMKAQREMLPSSYDVAPGIMGADGIVRGRISDVELYDMFCPDWPKQLLKQLRRSMQAARTSVERVEALARFYREYESCEVSPFDASEDTDVLPS